jgi:hypothetical protein
MQSGRGRLQPGIENTSAPNVSGSHLPSRSQVQETEKLIGRTFAAAQTLAEIILAFKAHHEKIGAFTRHEISGFVLQAQRPSTTQGTEIKQFRRSQAQALQLLNLVAF